ncbi:MAG TPA: DUF2339 domain-containing protein [Gemmatimonadales bacterium]
MSDDDRLSRLEHRLEVLEGLVRQLLAQAAEARASDVTTVPRVRGSAPQEPHLVPPPQTPSGTPSGSEIGMAPARDAGYPIPAASREFRTPLVSEQWLGQRGLLAVGVIFVILAAGYLLKLSFDRGWVSPVVRCIGGTIIGAAVALLGWRLHGRGTRTYGAALIGCGAAIVYLAVWAAARLYQFLAPTPAIGALALVSLSLAAIALAIDVQALGAAAALGALFAPVLVGRETGSVNLLLVYLGAMAAALGWVAAYRRWRIAASVIALAYFGVASSGIVKAADPAGLYLYAILGGALGLYVGLRERWAETRLLSFGGGWSVLAAANDIATSRWPTLLGGVVITAPVWWRALTAGAVWPGRPSPVDRSERSAALGESFYFFASPILLGWALYQVAPRTFDADRGLAPLLVAVPYLMVGLSRAGRLPFAVVGAVALVVAAFRQWPGLEATWALLVGAGLWAMLDRSLGRFDGRWYAVGTLTVALWHLLVYDLPSRPSTEAAFVGAWAGSLWWAIVTGAVLATIFSDQEASVGSREARPGPILWVLAGVLLLGGVTGELTRAFRLSELARSTADLAGGLSVSAWWICFAAGCFFAGFRRGVQPLRIAGFLVAGLALLKVVFVDLSELDALYRVGSAFILGVVSLAVAYAYHRTGVPE